MAAALRKIASERGWRDAYVIDRGGIHLTVKLGGLNRAPLRERRWVRLERVVFGHEAGPEQLELTFFPLPFADSLRNMLRARRR